MSYIFFWEVRGNFVGIVWEFRGIILKLREVLREVLSKALYFYNHF